MRPPKRPKPRRPCCCSAVAVSFVAPSAEALTNEGNTRPQTKSIRKPPSSKLQPAYGHPHNLWDLVFEGCLVFLSGKFFMAQGLRMAERNAKCEISGSLFGDSRFHIFT